MKTRTLPAVTAIVLCSGCPTPEPDTPQTPPPSSAMLPISVVFQQTEEWCWLASAQMILQYYNVPSVNGISYQCGIMGAIQGPNSICYYDCSQCVFGSGTDAEGAAVLQQYTSIVKQYYYPQIPIIVGRLTESEVTTDAIAQQVANGHPVEIGITPSGPFQGQAQHDVVVVGYSGYDQAVPGKLTMVINDPFPYNEVLGPNQNPYYQLGVPPGTEGTYELDYGLVAQGLKWSDTITTGVGAF